MFFVHGHLRMLEIARAVVAEPSLILLDEPAAGLNRQEIEQMVAVLKSIVASGRTILLVEHNAGLVMRVAETVTVLDHGEKIAEDIPEKIQKDPIVIKAYLGEDFLNVT